MLKNTYISLLSHLTQKPNLLLLIVEYLMLFVNTLLMSENRMVVWVQSGCKCMGCFPHDHVGDLIQLPTIIREYYITYCQLGKKKAKVKVQLLLNANHFHTIIRLKNCKLNHCQPGIICIDYIVIIMIYIYNVAFSLLLVSHIDIFLLMFIFS